MASLHSSTPLIVVEESGSPRSRSRTLDSTSSSSGSSSESVSIEAILADIVHEQLGLQHVDLTPIIQKFHDNWIYELKVLQTLEKEHVTRLNLPIAVCSLHSRYSIVPLGFQDKTIPIFVNIYPNFEFSTSRGHH